MARTALALVGLLWALSGVMPTGEASAAEPQQRAAPNVLQTVDYALLPAGGLLIKVVFRDGLKALPPILVTHYPVFRISLDFADTASAAGKQPFEVGQGGLRSFQVAQTGTRTRLVLNLDRPYTHEMALKGNELLITLQRRQPSGRSGLPGRFEPAPADAPQRSLRDVAFQPRPDGAGGVLIEVSHANAPVDVRRQGNTLVVDFVNAQLPRQLARRLDVQDFGTPVRAIETYPVGANVRIAIEVAGAEEILVYQVERQFVLAPTAAGFRPQASSLQRY
jgi:type IV pilus assembly protein PilQ